MAHDAEYDCVQGEQHRLLGDGPQPGTGLGGGPLRWVCGAAPHPAEPVAAARRGGPDLPPPDPAEQVATDRAAGDRVTADRAGAEWAGRVPRQRDGASADGGDPAGAADARSGCHPQRPGWAGAHRHGEVRPRSRAHRRERPPQRWC